MQRGIEEEEERRRGIEHIDGGDAAVGEVLLGEKHGRAIDVGGKAVRGERLTVGEDGELGIVAAAGFFEVGGQFGCRISGRALRGLAYSRSAVASIC